MQKSCLLSVVIISVLFNAYNLYGTEISEEGMFSKIGFWVPKLPPRVHYTIDCHLDPAKGSLRGTEIIRLTNNSQRPIKRLALDWLINENQTVEITSKGQPVRILWGDEKKRIASPILFELPKYCCQKKI